MFDFRFRSFSFPSALAGPVRRTWVRVLTPEPSRVKSESADGADNESRPARLPEPGPNSAKEAESAENGQGAGFALDAFDAAVSCAG